VEEKFFIKIFEKFIDNFMYFDKKNFLKNELKKIGFYMRFKFFIDKNPRNIDPFYVISWLQFKGKQELLYNRKLTLDKLEKFYKNNI